MDGLRKKAAESGPRAIVYAAANSNHAAEILEAAVFDAIHTPEAASVKSRVCFLNTVIGKLSGVVSDVQEGQAQGLATVTPQERRSFLVEILSRILISRICF